MTASTALLNEGELHAEERQTTFEYQRDREESPVDCPQLLGERLAAFSEESVGLMEWVK